jgi:hypothetical protein
VRDKETTRLARAKWEKFEPLIRRLKNTTSFHLQAFSQKTEQNWWTAAKIKQRTEEQTTSQNRRLHGAGWNEKKSRAWRDLVDVP